MKEDLKNIQYICVDDNLIESFIEDKISYNYLLTLLKNKLKQRNDNFKDLFDNYYNVLNVFIKDLIYNYEFEFIENIIVNKIDFYTFDYLCNNYNKDKGEGDNSNIIKLNFLTLSNKLFQNIKFKKLICNFLDQLSKDDVYWIIDKLKFIYLENIKLYLYKNINKYNIVFNTYYLKQVVIDYCDSNNVIILNIIKNINFNLIDLDYVFYIYKIIFKQNKQEFINSLNQFKNKNVITALFNLINYNYHNIKKEHKDIIILDFYNYISNDQLLTMLINNNQNYDDIIEYILFNTTKILFIQITTQNFNIINEFGIKSDYPKSIKYEYIYNYYYKDIIEI